MLALNNITLVCVDTVNPDLALYALRRCTGAARFGRVVLFGIAGMRVDDGMELVPVDDRVNSAVDYSNFVVNELPDHIDTDFALIIQWDGFIINPGAWTDEFLEYDYIGAPWPHLVPSVGNGGFSLRSRRLMRAARNLHMADTHPEDVRIAVDHGELLQKQYGIRFAPVDLAQRFSFENTFGDQPSFGFHALFNFHLALEPGALRGWLRNAPASVLLSRFGLELARRMHATGRGSEAWPILYSALAQQDRGAGIPQLDELWKLVWSGDPDPDHVLKEFVSRRTSLGPIIGLASPLQSRYIDLWIWAFQNRWSICRSVPFVTERDQEFYRDVTVDIRLGKLSVFLNWKGATRSRKGMACLQFGICKAIRWLARLVPGRR